ncbi:MAG: hypothetical protein GC157_15660 [Frankiales bacterium]|nr:hypothetical protein [Frankiales bacterium]
MAEVDVDTLADELYAMPPEQFIAARASVVAVAREAGQAAVAAELGALRKPTVTAWLANQVVRAVPDVVAGVIAIGPAMREATVAGDAAALRDLGRHRAALLGELIGAARAVAEEGGRAFTATHQRELEATFTAAAVDEDAAAALLTGRISAPLEVAGLGFGLGAVPHDRAQPAADGAHATHPPAPAGPSRGAARGPTESAAERRAAERQQAADAERERAVVEAEQSLAEARLQDADAQAALAQAQEAFDAALAAENAAAEALRAAKDATSDARADLTAAKADATSSGRAVAAALTRLDKATRR